MVVQANDINALNIDDGITAISDIIYSTSAEYEPVVVIRNEAKNNFVKGAIDFYKQKLQKKFKTLPFRVLSIEETKIFLEGRYSETCDSMKERMEGQPF